MLLENITSSTGSERRDEKEEVGRRDGKIKRLLHKPTSLNMQQ